IMAGAVLSAHEREEIRVGIEVEESLSDIARRLGRVPSTVTREVKRNGGRSSYCAVAAQGQSERLRSRPRDTTFQGNPELARHVEDRLRAKDSPTTIAIELARAGGIGGDCEGCGGEKSPKKAGPLGTLNLIPQRPPVAAERSEVGHFEGDLIIGARGKSAIVTLIDGAGRRNLLGDLPGGYSTENVLACCIELFERMPVDLRGSLTWDQGREMARHDDLADAVGIDVFFAEPHSPWMRPTNENFNGLLRRYVGKGTDLSVYSQDDLDVISHRINTMPRRIFQWASAQDRYNAAVVARTA
ncbi:Integrase catalytic region, partial [mine drainage metagenome]